jgi:hypothetical protein
MVRPTKDTKAPDRIFQNELGIGRKRLVPFSRILKSRIDRPKDSATFKGLQGFFCPKLPPNIMGSKEKMHGAKTVKMPARKEIQIKFIGLV